MAERDDDRLTERYRALGREEPPRELDARILAASRRATRSSGGPRRWALPLSIAALLVLSVSVTLQMQREPPGLAEQASAPAQAGKAVAPPTAAPVPTPPAADEVMGAPALERGLKRSATGAMAPQARPSPESSGESPERWLARIAELRRNGRDDEADRQLAEFRRRFPGYRIPDAMREKVERR
jgi:hypothetical protein